MTSLALRFVARTNTGLRRSSNQDSAYASSRLIAVADGMGGAAAGDLASATAMNVVRQVDRELDEDPRSALLQAVRDANKQIGDIASVDPTVDGMGTTLEAMFWTGENFVTAHIGDSRAYRLRDGELTQLSQDHTFVQSLVDEGKLTPNEARVHPHRSLLLRVMLGRPDNEPDMGEVEGRLGDRYLLCSDGLTDMVTDANIAGALREEGLDDAADRLIELALAGGGLDNVTVVIGELVEAGGDAGEPQLVGAAADGPRRRSPADTADLSATIAPPPDPEELRYSYVPPSRMRWLRLSVVLGLAAALLAVSGIAAYQWSQRQYFVGTSHGKVVIYRGVQADLPLVTLRTVDERTDIPVAKLPAYPRRQVTEGIEAVDRADAERTVAELRDSVPKPKHKPKPKPSPSASVASPTPAVTSTA